MTSETAHALTRPLGWELEVGPYSSHLECIGAIETTPAGNVALRIGAPIGDRAGWTQTAYIVLTPAEAEELGRRIAAALEA